MQYRSKTMKMFDKNRLELMVSKQIMQAILTDDGRVLIQQADGSYTPVDQDKTDLIRLDAYERCRH